MEDFLTKDDLRQFGLMLTESMRTLISQAIPPVKDTTESLWIKSKSVRKLLDISAGSVQNLRISKKVRFKKVLGSYYYNKEDLQKLFDDEK
ncbi:MerR family transcriptional regulator [Flavobacterium ustbae]|uniref:DNA-binding protein n=1 Tax=Flavobacterium ustbae TaxID=2488790 RepID=UPI000F794A17|nr:DNA-binding protein [Flavobacterium ustbae]